MKLIPEIILIGIFVQILVCTQADARGQLPPPPPPFHGGNIGEWLGSGPVFGFEPPSAKNPWIGGGPGSNIGSGGANGGWGGAWWTGDGPLGGGGWGGWGSGMHDPIGGTPSDTGKKLPTGHVWSDQSDPGTGVQCFVQTETGGYNSCRCQVPYPYVAHYPQEGTWLEGVCKIVAGTREPVYNCSYPDAWCSFRLGN